MQLRPYQNDLVDSIRKSLAKGNTRICTVLGCGGGKSVIQANIARMAGKRGNHVLFLVHRKELCEQIYKTFAKCGVDFNLCQIGMVQTVCRRLDKTKKPSLIFIDECFVKGTMIDGIPIEQIKPGMKVRCFDEAGNVYQRKVVRVFKNRVPRRLVKVIINGRDVVCTGNHPFLTKRGWINASALKEGEIVYVDNMSKMRWTKNKQGVESVLKVLPASDVGTKQSYSISKNEGTQSDAQSGKCTKNEKHTASNGTQTKNNWWKWPRFDNSSKDVERCAYVEYRGSRKNQNRSQEQSYEISYVLQNRCSECRKENSYRGRRNESCDAFGKRKGSEERGFFKEARVESVEIYKSTDSKRFAELCPDGCVYNLEVEEFHTYFANGIAVHNCHHSLSASYLKIIEYFPDAIVIGFTATPIRLNEGGLGKVFQDLVTGVSTKWLIENHYLAPYKYYGVTLADTTKLHTKNGDYDKAEVEALMNQSYIFGSAVDNWLKYANGKQTIIYCSSIATSKAVQESFSARGISCMHLDGTTPQKEREAVVEAFRNGEIACLTNVDLFGEGFDVPDCMCVVLLRPTKSLSLHIQQSMRSMRYKPGKVGIILDHVGNYARHGLPDDDREWSLEGREKRAKTMVSVKECPECFAVNPANAKVCRECGAELKSQQPTEKEKKIIEEVILEEIRQKPYDAFTECKTFADLVQFQKAKKFKFQWVIRKAILLHIKIPTKYAYMMKKMGMNYREVMEFIE